MEKKGREEERRREEKRGEERRREEKRGEGRRREKKGGEGGRRADSVEGGWVEFYRFTTGGSGCDLASSTTTEYLPNRLTIVHTSSHEQLCLSYARRRVIRLLDHAQDCWSAKNGRNEGGSI